MNFTIAVLLTCHNRREKTLNCLNSLYTCRLPVNHILEVFFVDDGSIDGTSHAVKTLFPKANIIPGDGTLFWNRGMLLAWETAAKVKHFDYYLWLNDDTILIHEAIVSLLEQANHSDNKRIIVGSTCSATTGLFTYGGYRLYFEKLIPNGTWQDCDYFNGNIVLVPSYVFQKIGYLDSRFRHTIGDFDYGMRANKMGFIHHSSPIYLGFCESHEKDPIWRDQAYSLRKRFKFLYSPLGNNPIEFFISDHRQYGILSAVSHFITIHVRTLFPQIWVKLIKKS